MTETCLCSPGAQSPGDLCNNQKSHGKNHTWMMVQEDGQRGGMTGRRDPDGESRWASWGRWPPSLQVNLLEEEREVQAAWAVILWWGRGAYGSLPRKQGDLCLGIMLLPVGEPSAGCSEEETMGTLIPHSGPLSKGLQEGLQGLPGTARGACSLSSPCPPDPGGHHRQCQLGAAD